MDVTKKDQVEALAREHEHVDVLVNVAGYFSFIMCLYCQEIHEMCPINTQLDCGQESLEAISKSFALVSCHS